MYDVRWLDKPDTNNPDEYINQCLDMCERFNRSYQLRRGAITVRSSVQSFC